MAEMRVNVYNRNYQVVRQLLVLESRKSNAEPWTNPTPTTINELREMGFLTDE